MTPWWVFYSADGFFVEIEQFNDWSLHEQGRADHFGEDVERSREAALGLDE